MKELLLFLTLLTFDIPEILQNRANSVLKSKYSLYSNPLKFLILKSIRIYQGTVSKVQGDVCNFIPSCSHYGYEAIRKYDIIKGLLMASDRVQRCHGFAILYYPDYYGLKEDSIRGTKAFDPVK
jgi:putative membrane protein insertion efficiency factor